jgi:hypothetical protein
MREDVGQKEGHSARSQGCIRAFACVGLVLIGSVPDIVTVVGDPSVLLLLALSCNVYVIRLSWSLIEGAHGVPRFVAFLTITIGSLNTFWMFFSLLAHLA